jgi:hypothetical protein
VIVAHPAWRWWQRRDGATADRGQTLVFDRLWVDHLPTSQIEMVQSFVAVTQESVGGFVKASQWKGEYELFRYEPRGDGQLELRFPQSREQQRVSYRAWKCNEPQFDFCLEMSGGKGARKYFSQRGWEVRSVAAARALAAGASRRLAD